MTVLKKGLIAAAAAGAMLFAGTAVAAPAQAATGWDRCPHGYACLFSQPHGQGTIGIFKLGSTDLRKQGLGGNVRSVWNRAGATLALFSGYNYIGITTTFPAYDHPVSGDFTETHSAKVAW
ncbi:peptidase inhibitor family I36 protein [Nocardiopsis potens]|uniref:peptidase inhibitor family I36 protein n=1 Tax=Nocardiopsis potens TaxID=1246458 RepID=UPI001F4C52C8|nr:peptidase inhibitor family I36 protein [Nocardiopsis potens]